MRFKNINCSKPNTNILRVVQLFNFLNTYTSRPCTKSNSKTIQHFVWKYYDTYGNIII